MTPAPEELAELAREIQTLIKENKRFLERIRSEEFMPEEGEEDDVTAAADFEEL